MRVHMVLTQMTQFYTFMLKPHCGENLDDSVSKYLSFHLY